MSYEMLPSRAFSRVLPRSPAFSSTLYSCTSINGLFPHRSRFRTQNVRQPLLSDVRRSPRIENVVGVSVARQKSYYVSALTLTRPFPFSRFSRPWGVLKVWTRSNSRVIPFFFAVASLLTTLRVGNVRQWSWNVFPISTSRRASLRSSLAYAVA